MVTENRWNVVKQPGKFDVMASLFGGKKIEFTVRDESGQEEVWRVVLRSVEAEDGSLQSWNVSGYLVLVRGEHGEQVRSEIQLRLLQGRIPVKGYIHSKTSRGNLIISTPSN